MLLYSQLDSILTLEISTLSSWLYTYVQLRTVAGYLRTYIFYNFGSGKYNGLMK